MANFKLQHFARNRYQLLEIYSSFITLEGLPKSVEAVATDVPSPPSVLHHVLAGCH